MEGSNTSDINKTDFEAKKLISEAEKSLKTGLLKWTPDYSSAADSYNKAAQMFRTLKHHDKSVEYFLKSIECHKNNRSWFYAAKTYEQLNIVLKETGNIKDIEANAMKASNLFLQNGSTEAAIASLVKTAKVLENVDLISALNLYQKAIDITMVDESLEGTAKYASKVSRIFIKLNRFDDAVYSISKEIEVNMKLQDHGQINRLVVASVLVNLKRCDTIAAEKCFNELVNYCAQEEQQMLRNLFIAYNNEDYDSIIVLLESPFIKHMDVEYAILARSIKEIHQNDISKNEGSKLSNIL